MYALESNPTLENTIAQLTAKVTEENLYSATVTGLELGEEYYIRGYAINEAGVAYSTNVVSFKPRQSLPELTTEHPTNISFGSGTATLNGTIVEVGDPAYTERGFVYGHDHNPTVEDDNKKEVTGNGEGAFSIKVTELEINTTYYIRAYAINDAGVGYGNEIKLEFDAVKPIVYTKEATDVDIAGGTATLNGTIESVGDPAYTERGFVYGTVHNPTIEDDTKKVAAGSGIGEFSANIADLVLNTIYYIRAYAKNSQGTAYGSEVSLNFQGTVPTVKTNATTNISIASKIATFNGSIENVGNPEYTERGFVYGLTHNPNIIDDTKKTALGSGSGDFSASVTNLEMNKIYYVRAYATNLQGTAYGNEATLDFSQVFPVVTTQAVSDIDETIATFNGVVESIGDPAYTERGFIYGTMQVPTIDEDGVLTVSASGTDAGAYARTVSDLETGKTYYVRAYAKVGTVFIYGEVVNFVAESPYYVKLSSGLFVAREDANGGQVASWSHAMDICNNSTLAGRTGWRLPTKDELVTMYNYKDYIGNFKDSPYWSSTISTSTNDAFRVVFSNGFVGNAGGDCYFRCVRK